MKKGKMFSPKRLKTMKNHLFKEFKEGWMCDFGGFQQPYQKILSWTVSLTLIGFIWIAINGPTKEWETIGIIYALLGGLGLLGAALNVANPNSLDPIAGPRIVGDFGILGDIILGAATVFIAILSSSFLSFAIGTPTFYTGQFTIFPERWFINLVVVGLMVPIVEDTFFGVVEGSAVEDWGVVPGIALVSFAFPMFHWAVYGQEWGILVYLFLWRVVAAFVFIYARSWGPPVYAHMIINSFTAIKLTVLKEVPSLSYISIFLGVILIFLGLVVGLYLSGKNKQGKIFKK